MDFINWKIISSNTKTLQNISNRELITTDGWRMYARSDRIALDVLAALDSMEDML